MVRIFAVGLACLLSACATAPIASPSEVERSQNAELVANADRTKADYRAAMAKLRQTVAKLVFLQNHPDVRREILRKVNTVDQDFAQIYYRGDAEAYALKVAAVGLEASRTMHEIGRLMAQPDEDTATR